MRRGEWRLALDRLHETNNFPEFTGLICPAPCEAACVLAINDDPVTIKGIEWGIIERGFAEGWVGPKLPAARTPWSVGVVGSGPAGLAAAEELNALGHRVVVYERDEGPGGLIRLGVPDFKLEKWIIDRRVRAARAGRDRVRLRRRGRPPTSCAPATTRSCSRPARGSSAGSTCPAATCDGIHTAMEYLLQRNRAVAGHAARRSPPRGKHVVVIGGGDTAADCVASAPPRGGAVGHAARHLPAARGPQVPRARAVAGLPEAPVVDLRARRGRHALLVVQRDRVHRQRARGRADGDHVGAPPDFEPTARRWSCPPTSC